jgi:hypothetical protein
MHGYPTPARGGGGPYRALPHALGPPLPKGKQGARPRSICKYVLHICKYVLKYENMNLKFSKHMTYVCLKVQNSVRNDMSDRLYLNNKHKTDTSLIVEKGCLHTSSYKCL